MARIRTNSTSSSSLRLRPERRPLRCVTNVALHADGRLDALVVAGNPRQLPVTEPRVEGACTLVFRPQFQSDDEGASRERGLFQPPDEAPADATAAMHGIDRQQIQVRLLL